MTLTKQIFNPVLALLMVFSIAMCGCDSQKTADKGDKAKKKMEHFHVHGPHAGGECFRFKDNTDFAAEVVTQGENNVVRVLFTCYEGKEKIEVSSDALCMKRKASDETGFELTAIAGEEEGKLKGFELDDEDLKSAIKIPMTVTITVGDKEFTGKTKKPH